jgi:hypothetical protein
VSLPRDASATVPGGGLLFELDRASLVVPIGREAPAAALSPVRREDDQIPDALRALLPRCEPEVLVELARRQRLRSALARARDLTR